MYFSHSFRPSRPMSPVPEYPKQDDENGDLPKRNTDLRENKSKESISVPDCDNINDLQDDNSEDPLSKIVESKFNRTILNNRILSNSQTSEINSPTQGSKNIVERASEADVEYVSNKVVENCSQVIVENVDCYASEIVKDMSLYGKDDNDDGYNVLVENNLIYEDEFTVSSSALPDLVSNSCVTATNGNNYDLDDNQPETRGVDTLDATYNTTASESLSNIPRDFSIDMLRETAIQDSLAMIAQIDNSSCGVPLSIFTKVSFTAH